MNYSSGIYTIGGNPRFV